MGRADLLSRSETIAAKKTVNGIVIAACAQRYSPRYTTRCSVAVSVTQRACVYACVCVYLAASSKGFFCINSRFMHSMFAEVPHSPFAPPSRRADAV